MLRHVWSGLLTSLRNSSTARRRGMRLGFGLLTSLRNSSTARRRGMRLGFGLLTSLRSSSTARRRGMRFVRLLAVQSGAMMAVHSTPKVLRICCSISRPWSNMSCFSCSVDGATWALVAGGRPIWVSRPLPPLPFAARWLQPSYFLISETAGGELATQGLTKDL